MLVYIAIILFVVFFVLCYLTWYENDPLSVGDNKDTPRIIWAYWGQGWLEAPETCKLCMRSWAKLNPTWRLRLLDATSLRGLVDVEDLAIIERIPTIQHKADFLRVSLLKKYGGVWVDATTFCRVPLDTWLPELGDIAFVFANRLPLHRIVNIAAISIWFIASNKDGYMITRLKERLVLYWSRNRTAHVYLLPHVLFGELLVKDDTFRELFEVMPKMSSFLSGNMFSLGAPSCYTLPHFRRGQTPVYKTNWRKQLSPTVMRTFEASLL